MAAKHPEDVLELGVGEEEAAELFSGECLFSVVKAVEEEERRRGVVVEEKRKKVSREEALWQLKVIVPEYDDKVGLPLLWDKEKKTFVTGKYGTPEEVEKCRAMVLFWKGWGFPERLLESARRSGEGHGRGGWAPTEGEKREKEWVKLLKAYRKQWAKILRAVGHSNDVVDTIFDVAAKHRGPEAMTMEDVKRRWKEEEEKIEAARRAANGSPKGFEVNTSYPASNGGNAMAAADGGSKGFQVNTCYPTSSEFEQLEGVMNAGGMRSVVIPIKNQKENKKSKKLMDELVKPPLPKLPRLQPSASNPPLIKRCIENAGRWVDFQPTSAEKLLPATARRNFDHRDDVISGFVSLGYDAGVEKFRIFVGFEEGRRSPDYLMIEKGEDERRKQERKEAREQLMKHKEKMRKLSGSLDWLERRKGGSGKKSKKK